ncbi:hypothetical protein GCM10008018_55610 [Paenibacillus marchantiophytorum]|uniref:YdhG-like domain-containing protein n=1 Tax=Paenibacillus marchantiophytorum TaxID=1619310 RepID=A0ABQ1F7Y0_9BACL|nr:DUF1801 domain-containing protein [Paenibacillus marchantiophytorum]GGA02370.1 hypothetical protein GCM10008018_55610 [Paenibacillus marchantiophytorum]
MNPEVTDFIEALKEPWQGELSAQLRELVKQSIPDVSERMQYKKPHFMKNGKYAAVISTSKDAVSFTIFNTTGLELPEVMFEGPPERKTLKLRKGDAYNSTQLASWVNQASSSL